MKHGMRSALSLMLFFILALPCAAANPATMFQNNTPFADEDSFPILSLDGETYAPLSFFCGFQEIALKQEGGGFCLYNTQSKRFFSYSESAPDALLTEQLCANPVRVPVVDAMAYLPLFSTAKALSLRVEVLDREPYTPVRLCDKNARLSFEVLWQLFRESAA